MKNIRHYVSMLLMCALFVSLSSVSLAHASTTDSFLSLFSKMGKLVKSSFQLAQVVTPKEYYIDPTYTGTSSDGSMAKPWKAIGREGSVAWNAINVSLASGPVTVYFSAHQATTNTPEDLNDEIIFFRTDASANRLTMDGMSKYNTNDASPLWASNTGTSKMIVRNTQTQVAIGVTDTDGLHMMNYVTVHGFEVTGDYSRVSVGGNHIVIENLWVHDIKFAPAMQLRYATNPEGSCTVTQGSYTDITFRNNLIERTAGEAMYIGGTNRCPSYGNSHSNILIENNTIDQAGYYGNQGDAIDVKDGLTNVTVRGNKITTTLGDTPTGITSSGVYSGDQNLVIENNFVSGSGTSGIQIGNSWASPNGVTIRNNVSINNKNGGINITGDSTHPFNKNIFIYNNTMYGNGDTGISAGVVDTIVMKNNIIFGNGYVIDSWGSSTNITSDYNVLSPKTWGYEGTHSKILTDGSSLVMSPTTNDFHLKAGSPAIDAGVDLSTSFTKDKDGLTRPQGSAWDIGAYEYSSPSSGSLKHPADISQNSGIDLSEMQNYAVAWKNGTAWSLAPSPVTLDYMQSAAFIWKSGEVYHYDSLKLCPSCFVAGQ